MGKRGGVRQQLKRPAPIACSSDGEEVANEGGRSYATGGRKRSRDIGDFLTSMFKIGRLSAPELQEAASATAAASSAGSSAPSNDDALLRDLASAGAGGKYRGNIHRDVASKLNKRCAKPQVYSTKICLWDPDRQCQTWDWASCLLPHEILDAAVGTTSVEEWLGFPGNPALASTLEGWKDRVGLSGVANVAGVGLWGDSAVYNTRDGLYIMIINVLSGSHRTRFWVCAFAKSQVCGCGCYGRCTYDSVFKVIAWSFQALLSGEYPSVRDDNVPFSESRRVGDKARAGWAKDKRKLRIRAGCIQKRGDWSWFKSAIGLVGWTGEGVARACCWKGNANMTDIPYTDFSTRALWRQTFLTSTALFERFRRGEFVSALFQIPGFMPEHISADLMHCSDLGVIQYVLGAVLLELFREVHGAATNPTPVLTDILLMIKQASKALKQPRPPINKLTLSMIVGKTGPKLTTKAAEGRSLLVCVDFMLNKFFPADNYGDPDDRAHAELRYACVHNILLMYEELERWGEGSAKKVGEFARKFLMANAELARESLDDNGGSYEGFLIWKLYPKHHLLQHVLEGQILVSGNPRESWCYCDESEIGAAVKVAEAGHPSTLHRTVIEKHRLS